MANPKAAATLYSLDGKSFTVVETLAAIVKLVGEGVSTRYCVQLTQPSGDAVWVNLLHVVRIEPIP